METLSYCQLMQRCGELEAQVKQLAAENAVKQEFISTCFRAAGGGADMDGNDIQELGERLGLFERQMYQPALHGYICGHEAGEDSVYVMKASPVTDAYAASLRAEGAANAIPEGYVLVPQQMFIDADGIEAICSQCGNGEENHYGEYTDGLLWVGDIQDDDGKVVHGLHISSADYSEEGGLTIYQFEQVKGVQP